MRQYFFYQHEEGGFVMGLPSPQFLEVYTIKEVAMRDTPKGVPFWIRSNEDWENAAIDHSFENAWELDLEALGEPDGYGMDTFEWIEKYEENLKIHNKG